MTTRTLIQAVNDGLRSAMRADDSVLVFGEDVGPKGGVFLATEGLTEEFGEQRCFDTPLSEDGIIGTAVGMAMNGLRPVAEIQFQDFIFPAFDQIVSEAARLHYRSAGGWNCPIVIRVPYGGGIHGSLYHSQSIEAFYGHVPGLKVVIPSTPADAKGVLWSAIEDPDPVMVIEPKKLYRLAKGRVPEGPHRVSLGTAAVRRVGTDVSIMAYGAMAHFAVEAADKLAEQGVSADVIDIRSIRPLDWPTVEASVQRTSKILIVHEDNGYGGFGAEISAQIGEKSFEWLDAPVRRYTAPEIPTFPYSSALEDQVYPSVAGIIEHAVDLAEY